MIRYNDKELRANLERVALYLVKIDHYVRLDWPRRWKTFTRGGFKKIADRHYGRPRKFKEELADQIANLKKPWLG